MEWSLGNRQQIHNPREALLTQQYFARTTQVRPLCKHFTSPHPCLGRICFPTYLCRELGAHFLLQVTDACYMDAKVNSADPTLTWDLSHMKVLAACHDGSCLYPSPWPLISHLGFFCFCLPEYAQQATKVFNVVSFLKL